MSVVQHLSLALLFVTVGISRAAEKLANLADQKSCSKVVKKLQAMLLKHIALRDQKANELQGSTL